MPTTRGSTGSWRGRATTAEVGGIAHQVALRAVARLVFTHAFAEEAVLFPAARRALPEGDPLTLRIETDHQEVDELVTRLDRSSPDDPAHRDLMEHTFAVLDHDVRTEEDELLPRHTAVARPHEGCACSAGSGSWCGAFPRRDRTRWSRAARRARPCPHCH